MSQADVMQLAGALIGAVIAITTVGLVKLFQAPEA